MIYWFWRVRWWFADRVNDAAYAICRLLDFADGGDFHYGSDDTKYIFPGAPVVINVEHGFKLEDVHAGLTKLIRIAGEQAQIEHAPYPHCDDMVLHAPGKCEVCDLYPTYQAARVAAGVNFTGEHRPDRRKCPSEERRPLETIERWPGNRPWES